MGLFLFVDIMDDYCKNIKDNQEKICIEYISSRITIHIKI